MMDPMNTTWLREGLRAGLLLRPRVAGVQPRVRDLLLLALLAVVVELGLGRLEVDGPAHFNLRGWLATWWGVTGLLVLVWSLLPQPRDGVSERPSGVASWFALWVVAALLPGVVSQVLGIVQAREWLPAWLAASQVFGWASYVLLWAWTFAIALRLAWHFGTGTRRLATLFCGLAVIFGITAWHFPDRPWEAPEAPASEPQGMALTQESIEVQQALLPRAVASLRPQRPGVTDVYGVVFAPYADEDVFRREAEMVAGVLAQRFDAQGRVLQLVNHAHTLESLPWATPRNLKEALDAIAQRMDRENDLLVLYLTSHGARDFRLAASNPPLQVDTISPGELRVALDEARIRHRVIAISACYSGGWLGPLAGDSTLVMTAADADSTSYGCGRLSELTFFGRAVFDEQLRRTHSFEQAFAAAVPLIRAREDEAGKADGFSNPQISVGPRIRPLLDALQQRLGAIPPRP
jgi:hypothetical protein